MRPRASRFAPLLILAVTLAYTGGASATPWQTGDLVSYSRIGWDTDPNSTLTNGFFTVYGGTSLLIGGGFFLAFGGPDDVLSYLPTAGAAGPLTQTQANPIDTSSGVFGGDVLSLQLDIDFSDANLLSGSSGLKFGDLILSNMTLPALDGLTVRQFDAIVNALLGGGSLGGFTIADITDLDPIAFELTGAFEGGTPSDFAQTNLVAPTTVSVPEPITLSLFGAGLAGALAMRRRKTKKA